MCVATHAAAIAYLSKHTQYTMRHVPDFFKFLLSVKLVCVRVCVCVCVSPSMWLTGYLDTFNEVIVLYYYRMAGNF